VGLAMHVGTHVVHKTGCRRRNVVSLLGA
jgi:hypothetical protein